MPADPRAIVLLDCQHVGKADRIDFGAGADLDGDGVLEAHEREAALVQDYSLAAAGWICRLSGGSVWPMAVGWGAYSTRHKRAIEIAKAHPTIPVAYLAQHLNATASYGLVVHDARSKGGHLLATHLAASLQRQLEQQVPRVRVEASDSKRWTNAWYTIRGVWAGPANLCGACYEPVSIDVHSHLMNPEGLQQIAMAEGRGVLAWLDAQGV